ncbi:trimeric intracellular cation channel family protein [Haematospirillum jordaniae]|uniref:Glycine transporter domain-containing protein n=1 Tax=Haematospirillum jordaniae TaxID=1549855 RepID=A0A143DD83_9PROT|nr:trimeric intracellular cation channel family protein [Haematospirillum jordaniae]AMW34694.1 hypothetical protein AY555_05325 [Haematospirillum jordaniae]NKD44766.1 trimeric intracellular cation channel family protein [Haematospirillum jordaniae]NKD56955.1 trimeric intracellular cation channel family protein [Haematospirillum jordaniae]NKD58889.1 trimeric intracellular cation channel family protein [Haematospirillum jordaniae]NKD66880.1 trimeric intracellular cation channel family protein [H
MYSHAVPYPVREAVLLDALGIVDLAAVAVFAITGALVAARREMDLLGFILVGTVTGIGGGTLRDLALGVQPVFWVSSPGYLVVCIVAAGMTYWMARFLDSRYSALLWADAVGLALYSVIGAFKAELFNAAPVVCVTMGMMTAAFGGLMRDIICGERSLLFNPEIYATAALAGSVAFVASAGLDIPVEARALAGFFVALALRAGAILYGWTLPKYVHPEPPPRPGEGVDRG